MSRKVLGVFVGVLVAMLLAAVTAASAFTVNSLVRYLVMQQETLQLDPDVVVVPTGVEKASGNQTANGTAAPGVEATNTLPQINNPITKGNWVYTFQVKEAAADSWPAGRRYRVLVYADSNLLTTLYLQNGTAANNQIEGVTVKVDLGSSTTIPDSIAVHVERVQ